MKKLILAAVITTITPLFAIAAPIDMIGGPDGTTQTMHHCGYLATSNKLYTSSPTTIRIVERKLHELGYRSTVDGNFSKADKAAVRKFQDDYGLKVDGVVGPMTAQRLALNGHPSAHTRSCFRLSGGLR